ncbi:FGGY-family carbohydrate kinase [Thalassotalea sp. PLHSN55]|uniref:FGGY-family carbohydrate kinase n=1 Tax=Thalassotalea sp. PLHSN55 TaxID=3435888 RepID=UPI003F82E99D
MSTNHPDDLFLVIDNGTQSIRAMIFNQQGELLAKSSVKLANYHCPQPGWAEQEAHYFWQMIGDACQQLWQLPDVVEQKLKDKIVAMSVTTQRGTVVNLDSDAKPLRPAILWLDQRLADLTTNEQKKIPWYLTLVFKSINKWNLIEYFYRKSQANWLAQKQPEIWQKTDKFLLLSGYLNYQLTSNFKDSVASIIGYLPFDYKKQNWAAKYHWKWQLLPISANMLPELIQPGELIGCITEAASKHIGLKQGLPVIASASDKACEVLGSGCISPNTANLSFGTTATINTNNKRYVEPQPFLPAYPSAIPAHYNSEIMIYRGFWMVNWFKQEFGQQETAQAQQLGVSVESLFDQLIEDIPAGSMGLMLQPYWSPSLTNLEAKGAMLGFGDVHHRGHIYRAILEGLAYALKEGQQTLAKRQGIEIDRLIISGGGSQSDAAMQLSADIFNLPTHRPHTFETSGLGAAINIAVGCGYFDDYQQAIKAMTHIKQTFLPDKKNVALYHQLYHRVYKKMYQQLKPLYKNIKDITGYPE